MRALKVESLLLLALLFNQSLQYLQPASFADSSYIITWDNLYSIIEYPLPNRSALPISVAASPDGTIWVLEQASNSIASFNPNNKTFRNYAIPTKDSFPIWIAVDSHGYIWFTELKGEKLGYLDPVSGRIIEYPIPGVNVSVAGIHQTIPCGPGYITFDDYDNIWIACLFSNQLDLFERNEDRFVSFDLPVFQSGPAGMFYTQNRIWFTAADANMLGLAELASMIPNTSQGIIEFAPLNDSYLHTFSHPTSLLGQLENITSSLPTPTSIWLDKSTGKLWITEHVDNSFDSYDPATKVLDKYWLSKTNLSLGYSYDFPNYIGQDKDGNLWIAEHYGNRIAVFSPTTLQMIELNIPCCDNSIAGAYTGVLDDKGNLWFVETNRGAIGEVVRGNTSVLLSATIPDRTFRLSKGQTLNLPIQYQLYSHSPLNISFDISGISPEGRLYNMTAEFVPSAINLEAGTNASVLLKLTDDNERAGSYFLTVSAISKDAIYSFIISLQIQNASFLTLQQALTITIALTLIIILAIYFARKRLR